MTLLLGVACLIVILAAVVFAGVAFGATAYVGWRDDQRQRLRCTDPVARHFYDAYRSPFSWHRNHASDATREAA